MLVTGNNMDTEFRSIWLLSSISYELKLPTFPLMCVQSQGLIAVPPLLCTNLPLDRNTGQLARGTLPETRGPYCSAQAVKKEPGWRGAGCKEMETASSLRNEEKQLEHTIIYRWPGRTKEGPWLGAGH